MTMQKRRNEPMPQFDFSKVGRTFMKEWADKVNEATRYSKVLFGLSPEGNSRAALEEFDEIYREYQAKIEAIGEEQMGMLAQIIKSIPKGWLVTDAPAEIDWSEPESLEYIQMDRYAQLMQMISEGQHLLASDKAKN